MIVQMMINTDDKKTVTKNPTIIKSVNAIPTDMINILKPELIMEYDNTILNVNYCYIPDFGKYYYLTKSLDKGKRIILHCVVDVLKTWDAQIRTKTGTILRSESVGSPTQIVDTKLPVSPSQTAIVSKTFDNKFGVDVNTSYCWILTTLGGEISGS